MQLLHPFTLFVATVSFGLSSFALPAVAPVGTTDIAVRQLPVSNITDVLTTLDTTVEGVVDEIETLVSDGDPSLSSVTPLIDKITSAVTTAVDDLEALSSGSLIKRQISDIATLVTTVLTDIITVLTDVTKTGTVVSGSTSLLSKEIGDLLANAEGLVPGVVGDITNMLGNSTGLLGRIGLDGILGGL